ncbi:Oxidoreductase [Pleurotus ostreatus]|uniref:Mitochondrial intermembrane space import and assembly protein 40 n=2 Tax=Pleurotus ostreatus TaxID=5322 RepID=A0A8H6ZW12_PLEOS|nr:Oxidoreductase [Pleurotus ostreatus]KAF7428593.1 Oxidoreductase [Pleurotus ostreatus]KAJ8696765.1 Oxidoreductase [Pleurotus ostreatus]
MFRRAANSSLRRSLHTSTPRSGPAPRLNRLGFALGASTVVATYLTLRLSLDSQKVALDGPASGSASSKPPQSDFRYPSFSPAHVPQPVRAAEPEVSSFDDAESSSAPSETTAEPSFASEDTTDASSTTPESETTGVAGEEDSAEAGAGGGGAYDPVTGEINWDCPCLGGMAHGPCGPQFREAFSCFIHSEDEPKGINCVEKFKDMQNCFREHPEIYAEEIMDDDDDEPEGVAIAESAAADEVRPPPESEKYEPPVEHINSSSADSPPSDTASTPSL